MNNLVQKPRQNGTVMFLALGIAFLFSLITLGLARSALNQQRTTGLKLAQDHAQFAAEAGLRDAEYDLLSASSNRATLWLALRNSEFPAPDCLKHLPDCASVSSVAETPCQGVCILPSNWSERNQLNTIFNTTGYWSSFGQWTQRSYTLHADELEPPRYLISPFETHLPGTPADLRDPDRPQLLRVIAQSKTKLGLQTTLESVVAIQ
jgi:Tfp pilus assembly protein PilX